jgi:hypothetical protein
MYETLQNLINKIDKSYIFDIMKKNIIHISSDRASNLDVFTFDLSDSFLTIVTKLKANPDFLILDENAEMLYLIEVLDSLKLNYNGFDYLVISNLGKYNVCFKIGNKTESNKSLYLDLQSIRIDIIDRLFTNKINYYYNIFNYGIKSAVGIFTFRYLKREISSIILKNAFYYFKNIGLGLFLSGFMNGNGRGGTKQITL